MIHQLNVLRCIEGWKDCRRRSDWSSCHSSFLVPLELSKAWLICQCHDIHYLRTQMCTTKRTTSLQFNYINLHHLCGWKGLLNRGINWALGTISFLNILTSSSSIICSLMISVLCYIQFFTWNKNRKWKRLHAFCTFSTCFFCRSMMYSLVATCTLLY